MRDQPVTKIAALTVTIKALLDQMAVLTAMVDDDDNNNNNNNPNKGGGEISVIRVRNKNHTIDTYRKSEYTRESDLEYCERRYYKKLKDDYYKFKISDSIYCCLFCYNKDYSLTDQLRHASRMAGNSCKTIKDIAKYYVLIMYIQRYLNVKDDKNQPPMLILLVISHLVSVLLAVSQLI